MELFDRSIFDPYFMMWLCFWVWLVGMIIVLPMQLFYASQLRERFNIVKDWRHTVMFTSLLAWVTMWAFRTLV